MAHEIGWFVKGRVIYQRFYGAVTLEELGEASRTVSEFVAEGTAPVHGLIDITAVQQHPTTASEIRRALRDLRFDPRRGWLIVIGVDPITRYLASVVFQLLGLRFRTVDTCDEALHFLAMHDETLDEPALLPTQA